MACVPLSPETAFVVVSKGGPFDVISASAKLILGRYIEDAWNHGKRVYKRRQTEENKFLPEILLFFWDGADGAAQCGWWFGDRIGGGQVWGFNPATTPQPPDSGWHCPVDGPVQDKLRCLPMPKVCRPQFSFVKQEDMTYNSCAGFQSRPVWKRPREDVLGATLPAAKKAECMGYREPQTFVMISTQGSEAPWDTQKLLGEYEQHGQNHGRRVFHKRRRPGTAFDEEPVYLYYWDERDGRDAAGWWLGSRIGGAERYGWAALDSFMPPTRFWRVPCTEATVRPDLWLVPTGHGEEVQMEDHERLAAVNAIVNTAEYEAFRALGVSQSVISDGSDPLPEALRVAIAELQEKTKVVEDAMNILMRHNQILRRAQSSCCQEIPLLEERLQVLLESVQKELSAATWKLEDLGGKESASQQVQAAG